RNPARHLAVVQMGLALLAGFGLDSLLFSTAEAQSTQRVKNSREKLRALRVSSVNVFRWRVAGIMLACTVVLTAGLTPIDVSDSLATLPQRVIRGVVWFLAAVLALILVLQLVRAKRSRGALVLLLGVIALDLVLYAQPLLYMGREPGHLDYLTADQFPDNPRYMVAFHEEESRESVKLLHAEDSGIPILNVYSSILPERAVEASNLLAGRPAETYLENHIELFEIARPDLLDMFGVRWLLVEPDTPIYADPSLRLVRETAGIGVYENPDALPLVRLVPEWTVVADGAASIEWLEEPGHDYAAEAVIEGDPPSVECPIYDGPAIDTVTRFDLEGGDIHITAMTAGPRLLVVNQTYVDGWRAWVGAGAGNTSGDSATVYPAYHRWLGVLLPCEGTYEVHLQYLPHSLQWGAVISLVTVIGIALAVGWMILRR
ncbi:MAG: hypothetical protein JXQ72_00005, partial [Anaerolineae bacterium]|nr:hypothetical protein [Anaerolineae bacterium]